MKKVGILYGCVLFMTGYVLLEQLLDPYWAGFELVVERHKDMLNRSPEFYNPWQYRILSTYVMEGFLNIWRLLPFSSIPTPDLLRERGINLSEHLPFILCKAILLFSIFQLFVRYLHQLGISELRWKIVGIWLLGFFMYPAQFSAGLSLDIYWEVIFYLLAVISLLNRAWIWIPLITLFAAFNRESSGFIPLLLLLVHFLSISKDKVLGFPLESLQSFIHPRQKAIQLFLLSCILYIAIFTGLRIYFGFPKAQSVYGNQSFMDFFTWNLSQATTYSQWLRSFTLLPFFALWFFPKWPRFLKMGFWMMVPLWLVIHLGHGVIRETRLFLVPTSLFLIPGTLWGLSGRSQRPEERRIENEK